MVLEEQDDQAANDGWLTFSQLDRAAHVLDRVGPVAARVIDSRREYKGLAPVGALLVRFREMLQRLHQYGLVLLLSLRL